MNASIDTENLMTKQTTEGGWVKSLMYKLFLSNGVVVSTAHANSVPLPIFFSVAGQFFPSKNIEFHTVFIVWAACCHFCFIQPRHEYLFGALIWIASNHCIKWQHMKCTKKKELPLNACHWERRLDGGEKNQLVGNDRFFPIIAREIQWEKRARDWLLWVQSIFYAWRICARCVCVCWFRELCQ